MMNPRTEENGFGCCREEEHWNGIEERRGVERDEIVCE